MSKRRPFDHIFDETVDGLVEKAVGDAMDYALDAFDDVPGATTTTTTVRVTSSSSGPGVERELYVMPFTPPIVVEPERVATYRDAPASFALAPRPRLRVRWWHRMLCRWGHDWRVIVVVKNSTHELAGLPKGLLVCRRCLRRWDRWPSDIGATRVAEALATARSCDTCGAFQDMPCDAAIHDRDDAQKGTVAL